MLTALMLFTSIGHADSQVKPTPTPTPATHHRKRHSSSAKHVATPTPSLFGYSGKDGNDDSDLPATKHAKHKADDSDSDATPTPSPTPSKKSSRHKAVVSDDEESTPTPSPSPSKKKSSRHKVAVSDDEDSTPTPSPSPSKKSSRHKAAVTDEDVTPAPSSSESPTPSGKSHSEETDMDSPTPTPSIPSADADSTPNPSVNASIATSKIKGFDSQSAKVQKIIEFSLGLASKNITYGYGSSDPASGTLDCSGFIYYTLRNNGFPDVPRDASGQYVWARKAGTFRSVVSRSSDSFELDELRPGDLLFWTGTYDTSHDPPVSHTMIYLGTEAGTGNRIMVGSSDGRTYHGTKRNGVSVFDFTIPQQQKKAAKKDSDPKVNDESDAKAPAGSNFIGYARIPGMDN